ncbi:hypothetical protein KQI82_07525 [Oscillibacter sp. MSJ-2]|uniref:Peptidase M1 membrane alanine aminopeptidase domain-containing protein n=1 Tax=Dysosmobacter acutus TaxID=2841504 RepID=A0ABS6F8Z5_9FIRM|nr:hypothetical protein [Dysosmobacter acutus]MBU5626763.1 hypothetical protein [Dysosmobacter acutus]
MKRFSLYRVELKRLSRNPLTCLLAGLSALAPLTGHGLLTLTIGDSMSALYLANPMLAGGALGAVFFALMVLFSLDQARRSGIGDLSDAIVNPMRMAAVRLMAVWTVAGLTAAAVFVSYLPYTAWKLDIVFSLSDYTLSVCLLFLPGPIMGALAAAALWQLVQRLDVSLLAVLAALAVSMGTDCRQFFLAQWCVPLVSTLSDAFGSAIVWRTALYSRVVWIGLMGGAWLLSLLCVRQYGRGALGSFFRHARRSALPVLAAVLLCGGGLLWLWQPFSDHSPANWMECLDKEEDRFNEALTLEKTALRVRIKSYLMGTMSGDAAFTIRNSSGRPQELYFELNSGYAVRSVSANGKEIPFEDLRNDMLASRELRCTLPAEEEIELRIHYGGMPKMWNEMESQLNADTISARSVTMTSKTLAPVVAGCVAVPEEAEISLRIDLKDDLVPVGTGTATLLGTSGDGTNSWMVENTGTDRLFLYAGDFITTQLDADDGTSMDFCYSKKYQERLKDGALDLMEKAIQYCSATYGPRSGGEGFKIIQTTAFNFGGFAVSGVSGMGESYFSDENLADPDKGPGSAEILAHEIIHQWWGLGATLTDPEDPCWNDEGITVYTTYRLMCRVMGREYAHRNYVKKWENTMSQLSASFYQRHPDYLNRLPERYQNDVSASAAGANWYDGNALMIYRAAERIGEEPLDDIWAKLYREGGTEMPPYITLGDFLGECGLEKGDVQRG